MVQSREQATPDGERVGKAAVARLALPAGTLIEGFEILRPLGEGGFGIVYLAWDALLERHVAIKEYMPSTLALRGANSLQVAIRSEGHRSTYEAGLKSFLNEARLLAKFDHPALLKVFRFWEGHGTAYMAMPYYDGPTLKEALAGEPMAPSEEEVRAWLHPLLDALSVLHREDCLHRDVSPDNIILTSAGPVLLDFGAARHVIHDMTQSLTAVLKPGFAPIEQYGGVINQGPWTDLYAVAGVVYYALTGQVPPAAAARVVSDAFTPLGQTHAGSYSSAFLHAIDATLSLRPQGRPQDAAQFRALIGHLPVQEPTSASASAASPLIAIPRVAKKPESPLEPDSYAEKEGQFALEPEPSHVAALEVTAFQPLVSGAPSAQQARPQRNRFRWGAAALVVAVTCSGAWWVASRPATRAAEVQTQAAPSAVQTPALSLPAQPLQSQAAPEPAAPAAPATAAQLTTAASPSAPVQSPRPASRPAALPKTTAAVPARLHAPADRQVSALETKQNVAPMAPESTLLLSDAKRMQRCSDLVFKASLESLTSDEVAFQKNLCK